jgi:hypothetical protein
MPQEDVVEEAPPPGFEGLGGSPVDDELDPSRSRVTSPPLDDETSAADSFPPEDEPPASVDDETTEGEAPPWRKLFQASTREPDPQIAQALAGQLGLLFSMLGLGLHRSLTPGPPVNDVWLATDEDVMGVCLPLGRIAARRVKVSPALAGDVADAIDAVGGTTAYVVNNLNKQTQLRAFAAGTAPPPPGSDEPPQQPPPGKAPGTPTEPAGPVDDLGARMPPPQ